MGIGGEAVAIMGGGQAPLSGGHVFVSYATVDVGYVTRLVDHLRSHGVLVWWDHDLQAGELWSPVLAEKIGSCAVFLVVMTPQAEASQWVAREINEAERAGRRIVPLLLAGPVFFALSNIEYENVGGGALPGIGFVQRLQALTQGGGDRAPVAAVRRGFMTGVVPDRAGAFQHRGVADRVYAALGSDTVILSGEQDRAHILSGLGGVGKTQLAADLALRLWDAGAVDGVFWVSASSRAAIVAGYAGAAVEVGVGDPADADVAAETFRQWLARTEARWLVVLDDVSDPADLAGLWPPTSAAGRTVVTTRRRSATLASHGVVVDVGVFTASEAHAYLADTLGHQPHRLVEAEELAADLGYLPLALGQAAAFVANQNLTCAAYRQRLARAVDLVEVLPGPGELPDDYPRSVAATLILSLDAADRVPPQGVALPLLIMLSLLDANGMPAAIITTGVVCGYLSEQSGRSVDAEAAWDGLACLTRFNLVDLTTPDDIGAETTGSGVDAVASVSRIRIHALLQRVARDRAGADRIGVAARAAADALTTIWPEVERDVNLAQLLRVNASALRGHAEKDLWIPDGHVLLFRTGHSLDDAGQVTAAVAYYTDLVEQARRILGPDHSDTLTSRNDLAYAYRSAGRLDDAIALYEAVLADR
jgi:hypothetical protein